MNDLDGTPEKKLSIHFHGICTHFRGIVAGVAHRVVLPDAMTIRGVMKPDALNAGLMAELLRQIDYDEGTSAACSDSRYP